MTASYALFHITLLTTLWGCVYARRDQHDTILGSHIWQKYKEPPKWPDSYSTTYTFSLPYTAKIQPHAISYPVTFHRDATTESHIKVAMDTFNRTNIMVVTKDVEYEIVPRKFEQVCLAFSSAGELAASLSALPDLTGWEYIGVQETFTTQSGDTRAADVWLLSQHHEAKHVEYKFYATVDEHQIPLRLHMIGNDIFTGAHFDEWVVDYNSYTPGVPEASLFDQPEMCEGVKPEPTPDSNGFQQGNNNKFHSTAGLRMASLLPIVKYRGIRSYDAFLETHGAGRSHLSLQDYKQRAALFAKNAAMIREHNAMNRGYTMAMNRFGDWTREEFLALMLPKHSSQNSVGNSLKKKEKGIHQLEYQPLTDPKLVPSTVDWRGTGADVAVKDQANCGSCWAFGAAGAMEAALFRFGGGQSISLSEQQIIDCSWGIRPGAEMKAAACDGGDADAGIDYIVKSGGISSTEDYEYLGQGNFCRKDAKITAKFKGYAKVPHNDESAIKEAVYSRGPLAVSIDASQDSFTFYSSGVYFDDKCMHKSSQLDHSVVLVGYGTDPAGDYWLIKNSWSEHWGDGGYVKIARDGGGCGVASDALYAVLDDTSVVQR